MMCRVACCGWVSRFLHTSCMLQRFLWTSCHIICFYGSCLAWGGTLLPSWVCRMDIEDPADERGSGRAIKAAATANTQSSRVRTTCPTLIGSTSSMAASGKASPHSQPEIGS